MCCYGIGESRHEITHSGTIVTVCSSADASLQIYKKLFDGSLVRLNGVDTAPFYQPECGGFCIEGCYVDDGPSVTRSQLQTGDVLRIFAGATPTPTDPRMRVELDWPQGSTCVIR